MTTAARAIAAALLCCATAAAAAEPDCPMTYPRFEAAVPHLDLERCPAALEGPTRFCRATVSTQAVHVFVFTTEGAQCLVDFATASRGSFALALM